MGAGVSLLLFFYDPSLLAEEIENVLGRAMLDADFPGRSPNCPLFFCDQGNQLLSFLSKKWFT